MGCISYHEAKELLDIKNTMTSAFPARELDISLDLGRTKTVVHLTEEGVAIDRNNLVMTWDEVKSIAKKTTCFALYDDGSKPWQISTISPNTGIPASLTPPLDGPGAPTLLLGGFTMHRIAGENVNPTLDTEAKMASVRINRGNRVLDTCMGLGYTAIQAAELVGQDGSVVTIEYDQASLEVASYNPWSQGLFDGTLNIEIREGTVKTIPHSLKMLN